MNLRPLTDLFPMKTIKSLLFDAPALLLILCAVLALTAVGFFACGPSQQPPRDARAAVELVDQGLQTACDSAVILLSVQHIQVDVDKTIERICRGEEATRKLREQLINGQFDLARRAGLAFPELAELRAAVADAPQPDRPRDAGTAQ